MKFILLICFLTVSFVVGNFISQVHETVMPGDNKSPTMFQRPKFVKSNVVNGASCSEKFEACTSLSATIASAPSTNRNGTDLCESIDSFTEAKYDEVYSCLLTEDLKKSCREEEGYQQLIAIFRETYRNYQSSCSTLPCANKCQAVVDSQFLKNSCLGQAEKFCGSKFDKATFEKKSNELAQEDYCGYLDLHYETGYVDAVECIVSPETKSICKNYPITYSEYENTIQLYAKDISGICPRVTCKDVCWKFVQLAQNECEQQISACESQFDQATFDKKSNELAQEDYCGYLDLHYETGYVNAVECIVSPETKRICKDYPTTYSEYENNIQLYAKSFSDICPRVTCKDVCWKFVQLAQNECAQQISACESQFDQETFIAKSKDVAQDDYCTLFELFLETGQDDAFSCILSEDTAATCNDLDMFYIDKKSSANELINGIESICATVDCSRICQQFVDKSRGEYENLCKRAIKKTCDPKFDSATFEAKVEDIEEGDYCALWKLKLKTGKDDQYSCILSKDTATKCKSYSSTYNPIKSSINKEIGEIESLCKASNCTSICQEFVDNSKATKKNETSTDITSGSTSPELSLFTAILLSSIVASRV